MIRTSKSLALFSDEKSLNPESATSITQLNFAVIWNRVVLFVFRSAHNANTYVSFSFRYIKIDDLRFSLAAQKYAACEWLRIFRSIYIEKMRYAPFQYNEMKLAI